MVDCRGCCPSSVVETKALLLENASRDKTPEQKVREAGKWKGIEEGEAKERQALGGGDKFDTEPLSDDRRTLVEKGRVVDKLAAKVGFNSGRGYERAAKVVKTADQLKVEGNTLLCRAHGKAVEWPC
jgi:hypothetical protein